MFNMEEFIKGMPKAELHVHIEGTVTPALTLELAERNKVDFPYSSVEEILEAQDYGDPHFETFIAHHYACLDVIRTSQDIYDITVDFLKSCHEENIRYVELMFDPMIHMERGMSFRDIIIGLQKGRSAGLIKYGVASNLQMCATREKPAEMALEILELARPFKDFIKGIGIDSHEDGNPPRKFVEFYKLAKQEGYRLAAHCDVWRTDSINNIGDCMHLLNVERIDHGVDVVDDKELMKAALDKQISFTMCPTWRPADSKPRRLDGMRKMFDLGLLVSVNTDDPTRFVSGYLSNMLIGVQKHTPYTALELVQLMRNAFNSAWIDEDEKRRYIRELNDYAMDSGVLDAE
jgi:adenosine deaminase